MAGEINKRRDKDRIVLRRGESQRKDGNYDYRWTTRDGKRHSVYAKTLEELRAKEEEILRDKCDGIKSEARYVTINDVFEVWKQLKRGLKDNTFQNYNYMYHQFVKPDFGNTRVSQLKKSDVKRFYNMLADERALKVATIEGIHTVLHQVLDMAVDEAYLRNNPSDHVLRELKQAHNFDTKKRKALTVAEQELFLDFLRKNHQYNHWYPIFAVMLGTGLRVGEVTGLRWCDVDLKAKLIDVNHTLVYYNHAENGCYFNINTPKTKAGVRNVSMLEFVKQAFIEERKYQMANGIRCNTKIDGYTDFIFVNRFGTAQHQGTLNKALRRIIRDCNDEVLERNEENPVLLPRFSCHSLRHTFTTRMCEAGVNIKVIQDALGHSDISTTLNIYADVTKELKKKEFEGLEAVFQSGTV
jgi:integrase